MDNENSHSLQDGRGSDAYAHIDWTKTAPVPPVLPALLAHCAITYGEQEILVVDTARLTYGDANNRSADLSARLLAAGIGRGARVAMLLPNGPDFVVTWLAIVRIGAIAIPLSTLSTGAELTRLLRDAGASLLICTDRYFNVDFLARLEQALDLTHSGREIRSTAAPHLRAVWTWHGAASWALPVMEALTLLESTLLVGAAESVVTPADPITIIYTSGSTAAPKGVIHSHGAFMRSSRRWAASMIYRCGDRHFSVSPMFWVGGLITSLLTMMQVGATLISSSKSDGAVLETIERERCTSIQIWPHLARKIEEDPTFLRRDFTSVRGGNVLAMVPPACRPEIPTPFGWAMGMTETAGPHTFAMGKLDTDHIGAMGLLADGMEHRIVDTETGATVEDGARGELYVRGDSLMLGYVGRERGDTFDQHGWFRTGDLCTIRDGYIFFHGRRDASFKSAGANVAPAEVEAALRSIPGVADACVVGIPDDERGMVAGAIVVPKVAGTLTLDFILSEVKPLLSSYKVPRRLLIVDSVPATATNKPDLRAVAALFLAAK